MPLNTSKDPRAQTPVGMVVTILVAVGLVSWAEYCFLDFTAPWIRVVAIMVGWSGAALFLHLALQPVLKRPLREKDT